MNFIANIKAIIAGLLVSVMSSGIASPSAVVRPVSVSPVPSLQTEDAGLPEQGYQINGTYSYFGQSVKYSLNIPVQGGRFTGTIEGACEANVSGDYEAGKGDRISGSAAGKCSFLFVKYEGSINFKGNLYPENKKIVVETENPKIGPVDLYYQQ